MADVTLTNIAGASGAYNGVSAAMVSEAVATLLVDGLSIEKSADKDVWVTDTLAYTITLTNNAEYAYEDAVVTDTLDISLVTLVEGSVMVNGVATAGYTYDAGSGLLTVPVSTIDVGGSAVVVFQVQKA